MQCAPAATAACTPTRESSIAMHSPGSTWGAQKGTASDAALLFEFYSVAGSLVDSYRLTATP